MSPTCFTVISGIITSFKCIRVLSKQNHRKIAPQSAQRTQEKIQMPTMSYIAWNA
jgi:hypothetical protein